MSQKRVIIFTAKLEMGGAERVASVFANYWAAQQWDVMLLTQAGIATDFYELHPEVERKTLNLLDESASLRASLTQNYQRIRKLRMIFKSYRPDAVVSLLPQSNILAIISSFGFSHKVIVSERSNPAQDPLDNIWQQARKRVYRFADTVVLQSSGVLSWATDFIPNNKIKIIPNPVISDFKLDKQHDYQLPSGQKVIAMGRLSREKNYDQLILAFALIADQVPTAHLVILGEGVERENLEKIIKANGLDQRVHLPGKINHPHALVAKADIIALSSEYEGFPNALLEGMALGLLAISYDCPHGPADLIEEGKSGYLIPVGHIEKMSGAMYKLLTNQSLLTKMALTASQVKQRYATPAIMQQWEALM